MLLAQYQGFVGLVVGLLAITFGPWLVKGLKSLANTSEWGVPFEKKYWGLFGLAVVAYLVSFAASPEARVYFVEATFTTGFVAAIGGRQLVREVLRVFGL
jgi:hypothetical protein